MSNEQTEALPNMTPCGACGQPRASHIDRIDAAPGQCSSWTPYTLAAPSDTLQIDCAQCGGEGEFEHPHMPLHSGICPEYAIVACEECDGTGAVPVEEPGDYLRDRLLCIARVCEAKGLHVEASGLRDTARIVSEQFKKWIAR